MKIDRFMIAMLGAVLLALAWPALGARGGPLHLDVVMPIGIAAVFFLHGAALSPAALRAGATHWRLHLMVQSTTFVLFPLIGGIIWFCTRQVLPEGLRLGFFFLCALPSTISSSIAMTALARGNVAVAVFNATLSGLIGMIATPLLIGLAGTVELHGGPHGPPLGDAILDIMRTLLLPFALGQLCRRWIGERVAANKRVTAFVDRGVIVLIVFASFSESTATGLWAHFSLLVLVGVAVLALLLLGAVLGYARLASRAIGLDRADEAAAVFCASKKSLANGAPMAQLLFAGNPSLGMIMLPMLLYHQIQLIVCAQLARRYAALPDPGPDPRIVRAGEIAA